MVHIIAMANKKFSRDCMIWSQRKNWFETILPASRD